MHQVIPAGVGLRLGAQHLKGELADLGGQVGLVKLLERAGDDAADQDTGGDLGQRRGVPADRPGEDVDFDAAGREPFGHLDDVHVQAARVTGARLVER